MESMNKKNAFNEYIESFSKLSVDMKQQEIVQELKLLITLLNKVNIDFKEEKELLLDKEKLKLKEYYMEEDEYLNSVFMLVQCLKNELGKHMDGIVSKLYKSK